MSHLVRTNAILPFKPVATMLGHEGEPVIISPGTDQIELLDAADVPLLGVLLLGTTEEELCSVAIASGSLAGTVKVKLGATVDTLGTELYADNNGYFSPEPGSGNHYVSAIALEKGVAGELIEAALQTPSLRT